MRRIAIVQGRMSSRRLPGKILADTAGVPLLMHVLRRAQAADVFDVVVMATSTDPSDDPVEDFCTASGFACFRGDLNNVLERYFTAAKMYNADLITRITADCPLLDPQVVRAVNEAFDPVHHDYVSNTLERTYPNGLDTEVFSMEALTKARERAMLPSEKEHVTPFIYKNPDMFRMHQITQKHDLSSLRWTVDELRDLEFVRAVFEELGTGTFGQREILALLKRRPELRGMNEGISNDGYQRSLAEDERIKNGGPSSSSTALSA
ncbi:glycosyltransferase family protein [Candidatus Peregrinibacteria bacterium]|nr:glycosyltransferase family protein [Candidatus Peregrinibacteria bacterium]MBI3816136.1 glycosyltransferase family protein [Candidatus Peregrinibacteria bacterium]